MLPPAAQPRRGRRGEGLLSTDREVVEASRPAWARAYHGDSPGRAECAVAQLAVVLSDEPGDPESGRHSLIT